jgi:type VI secretion system secreted protein Hcp
MSGGWILFPRVSETADKLLDLFCQTADKQRPSAYRIKSMRTKLWSLLSATLLAAAFSMPAAAVDYFLKIDGIPGESANEDHRAEIDVLSWSWGESQPGLRNTATASGGGGGGAGKVSMQDFHFTMKVNKATPKLMLACAKGEIIPSATLTLRRASADPGGESFPYLKVTFTDLLISSYQTGGSAGDVIPTDQISFNFTKIEMQYTVQDTGEIVEAEYDSTPILD